MKNWIQGFSLLEVLIAVQLIILLLTYSSRLFQQVSRKQKILYKHHELLGSVQSTMETVKSISWADIRTDISRGIVVEVMAPDLKRIAVSSENIILETVLYNEY